MNDSISSVEFLRGCDDYYDTSLYQLAWDLNGDLIYETFGATAAFSAASIDGPTTAAVPVRVRHPYDGRIGTAAAAINVFNVPPVVTSFSIRDGAGREVSGSAVPTLLGLPLTLAAGFTDPGVADTQAASIDWGDGVVSQPGDLDAFTGATGGLTGHLAEEHAYFAPAVYTVLLHLSDDDGGLTDTSTTVRVLDARGAIVEVIAAIDLLLAGATGAERAALLAARDLLDGNLFGASVNGAVDKLDGGDLEAAALKIQQAIVALREADAVTGLDTTDLQATLALAAQSIAIQSQREAIAASIPPTSGEKRQLARIETLLVSGESFLAAGDLVRAATKFHDAVQLAESMY